MIREKQRPVAEAALPRCATLPPCRCRKAAPISPPPGRLPRRMESAACSIAPRTPPTRRRAVAAMPRRPSFTRYGIAGVFEYGATMHGRPLMWIPTTHRRASRHGSKIGQETDLSATVNGTPLAVRCQRDKDRDRKPLYHRRASRSTSRKNSTSARSSRELSRRWRAVLLHFKDND